MPEISWKATPEGRYWIDVVVAGRPLQAMVDAGLVDPRLRVGYELEANIYDQLRWPGRFSLFRFRSRRDAGGRVSRSETGLTTTQLLSPSSGQPVGPVTRTYVSRGLPGLPNRVGVVFFHQLTACRVAWDLDGRMWSIEYP
jgi:hypothetical protein